MRRFVLLTKGDPMFKPWHLLRPAVAVVGLATGCTAPERSLLPAPIREASVACPRAGPPPPGCETLVPPTRSILTDTNPRIIAVPKGSPDYAAALSGGIVPPIWFGEPLDKAPGEWICPAIDVDPVFAVHVDGHGLIGFYVFGKAVKLEILAPSSRGIPRARYLMPPGVHRSTLPPGWKLKGGTLTGTCYWKFLRFFEGGEIRLIGFTKWDVAEAYEIFYDPTGSGPGGSMENGYAWGMNDGSWFFTNSARGSGGGGQLVYQRYRDYGVCTPGWQIWVDDFLMCNTDGSRVA
jgi:hypothetical protein